MCLPLSPPETMKFSSDTFVRFKVFDTKAAPNRQHCPRDPREFPCWPPRSPLSGSGFFDKICKSVENIFEYNHEISC